MSRYTIHGALGSPYSLKMRAIFRYRRIPHVWKQIDVNDVFAHAKVPVVPVIQFPDGSWHNDSTPMIYTLERLHAERSVLPADPVQHFIAFLLEDMADEWGTKAMFHYRWYRERDQMQMSKLLSFDRFRGKGREMIMQAAKVFRSRQTGRMAMVGCTPENAPILEESANRVMALLDAHVAEEAYLFGTRPSIADFGWYGQLSQLGVDPTPADLMRETAPFLFRWLMNVDDLSGVDGEWRDPAAPLPAAVTGLLAVAGDTYFPFLLANAAAFEAKQETFSLTLHGRTYTQGAFRYQQRCLWDLRERYKALDGATRERLDPILKNFGCLEPLKG